MSSLSEPRRPRLLPQNRKLRHLKGVWLRNLSFAPTTLRTTDDAELNKSPKKLQVLRETSQLHASRSSEHLRKDTLRLDTLPLRPQQTRRTSLSLAHASPVARQKKLEALVDEAVGDVFFSLHVDGDAEPVYVSEVRERSAVSMQHARRPGRHLTRARTSTSNFLVLRVTIQQFRDHATLLSASGRDGRRAWNGSFSSRSRWTYDDSTLSGPS